MFPNQIFLGEAMQRNPFELKPTNRLVLRNSNRRKPTVVDLFCGCGGLSEGFRAAGYEIIGGVDSDESARKTFKQNFPDAHVEPVDLSQPCPGSALRKLVGAKQVDIVVAGPPCQGFSLTGTRNFDDARNSLYLSVFEVVKELKPRAFVIENVRGMATLYGGQVRDEVIRRFKKLGYRTVHRVLCAADFGVPQLRHRLFFVALRGNSTFEFPVPTHGPDSDAEYVSCGSAISDLPPLNGSLGQEESAYENPAESPYQRKMRKGKTQLWNHVATKHTELVKSVIGQVPPGGNHRDLEGDVGKHRKFNEAWTRYHHDRPSWTIDTGHRNHFHYRENRVPTVRENARLQSFPDKFRFLGTRTSQYRQVGNAVPPLLAESLAIAIAEQVDW